MVFGRKGFYKVVNELTEPKKSVYEIKWSGEYRPDWAGRTERRLKKGIDIKTLTRQDKDTEKNIKKWLKINKNIRKFNNEGVAFSIRDEKEIMIALIKSNVTLHIKDPAFTKLMKNMFLATYNQAEKIK